MKQILKGILFFTFLFSIFVAKTAEEWKTRTIYQILTDRFSRGNGDTSQCNNLQHYCGGTYKGIQDNLDYITGMGFDAIWISPILKNYPNSYHGYHAIDFTKYNDNFGTEEDLKSLISACHDRDVWVMLDIVGNHVGPVGTDFNQIYPFNQNEHYHNWCDITSNDFATHNMINIRKCRLASLPDLNQDNSYVRQYLKDWVKNLMTTFDFDGFRVDTVTEVDPNFWKELVDYVPSYFVGEVFDGDYGFVGGFTNYMPGILNYPNFNYLRGTFKSSGQSSMYGFENHFKQLKQSFKDVSILGTFIDNHDNVRFLNYEYNFNRYKNALLFVLAQEGIPIIYYGTEQQYAGGNDPQNREVLWISLQNPGPNAEMYQFLKNVIFVRKQMKWWNEEQVQRYAQEQFYAFTRGQALMAFTNQDYQFTYDITYHPYSEGQVICNFFNPRDCLTVNNNQFTISMNNGECKMYIPKQTMLEIFNETTIEEEYGFLQK